MKIKKYIANDMAQACELIKEDLGSEALILSTQQLKPSGFGLRKKPQIEVVAGITEEGDVGHNAPHATAAPKPTTGLAGTAFAHNLVRETAEAAAMASLSPAAIQKSTLGLLRNPIRQRPGRSALAEAAQAVSATAGAAGDQAGSDGAVSPDALERIERSIADLRSAVDRSNRPKGPALLLSLSEPVRQLYTRLQEQEVPVDLCDRLIADLRGSLHETGLEDEPAIMNAAFEALTTRFREARPLEVPPGQTSVMFFVGPTGSGKTTTAVKLAVRLTREGHSVLLVNADVARPGSVQQLEAYANALNIPSETVYSAGDLRSLIARASAYSAILVDTSGASPENAARLKELRTLLGTVRRKDVYLVLNATGKLSDLRRACERFEVSPITGLVLTRRDETQALGQVLALLTQVRTPLAFLGTGQDVLGDLLDADIRELSDAVLGRERHHEMVAPMAMALGA